MGNPDLFARVPLPWTVGRGAEFEQDTHCLYDAHGVWVAEVRMGTGLGPLFAASPQMLEELEELERFFRGCREIETVTKDQAQRWAAILGEVSKRARGGR